MVQGNFAAHDYFIDCDNRISRSVARAVFGAWVTVCIAVVAACVRSMYRSRIKHRLFGYDPDKPPVNLWSVSPAVSPSEVIEGRSILTRSCLEGNIFHTLASLACIVAGIVSAASTSIANRAIESNVVTRSALVPGVLATNQHNTIAGAVIQVSSRAQALERANAPLTQLFDFAPNDTSGWIYVAEEWNNTWKGRCAYHLYPAVDLHVYTTNSTSYQDELPGIGVLLPQWATIDQMRQGNDYAGFYGSLHSNNSGVWLDILITYAFGSEPNDGGAEDAKSVNISLANVLLHNVGRTLDGKFVETMFASDVHVVECTFDNSAPGTYDQSFAQGGQYLNAAGNVGNLYRRAVVEASIDGRPVVQPTAQQMIRYWQAFMSVKDSQYPHLVQRWLSVSRPVVQIRLSVLLATIGGFLLAVLGAVMLRLIEPRDQDGRFLNVPGSQLDWIVLAACEHQLRAGEYGSAGPPARFAAEHEELGLVIRYAPDGQPTARIISTEVTVDTGAFTDKEDQYTD